MTARLTDEQRVAVVLLSIEEERAAAVLRLLPEERVAKVSRAMRELQDASIDHETLNEIYSDLLERIPEGVAIGDVRQQMEGILIRAFGRERGTAVGHSAANQLLAQRPLSMFESLPPEDLAELVADEHPQIVAVFVAHLDAAAAGRVLAEIPDERRADVVRRVATLDRTPPEVVDRVLDVMRQKLQERGLDASRSEPRAWIQAAARMLCHMGGQERSVLSRLEEKEPAIANRIREEMFTFEDLAELSDRAMQRLLGHVDTQLLALAMKNASAAVDENVFRNLSQRAGALLSEERSMLGPTPLTEVVDAQKTVLRAVRDLMDRGEISLVPDAEELV